jgi:integral membrane protein (TIGR01906 family)
METKMSPVLKSALSWVVTLLVPYIILMTSVQLMLTPLMLQIEYNLPGFPTDPYGFTTQDRLRWATPSVMYLTNDRGISYLAELFFDDGTPIYNARELSHMKDVKDVLQILQRIWYTALATLIVLAIWARRSNWLDEYNAGWRRGGFLMVGLLVAVCIFAFTSFMEFFTWFHSLFFTGASWQFAYSDTLIRLFPVVFWQNCFIFVGVFSLTVALVLIFGLKPKPQ